MDDDTEDDARHPHLAKEKVSLENQGYGSSTRQRIYLRNETVPQSVGDHYLEDSDDGDTEEDENDVDIGENGVQRISNTDYGDDDDSGDAQRQPKKRKLKTLLSSYEFAPRVPAPPSAASTAPKPSIGGRNSMTDWTEHETSILLDAWGDKFLQHGRKSLRSDEWQTVAEIVSQESKFERTDTQCRNRLDTLKKKYKKEKLKLSEDGSSTSKWVFFKKLDTLLSLPPQQGGLSCGMDSGEYVLMHNKVHLNHANGLNEMRDGPGNSASGEGGEEDDSEGLPPKRAKNRRGRGPVASFTLLADSIQKFSDMYEKIENDKSQQMVELEKMRMEFYRDLELQKRKILERAQAEIAKIRHGVDEENDESVENVSG